MIYKTPENGNGGECMAIASMNVVPEDLKTSIIRIYSYQDKNLQGVFYNLYYGEEIVFTNLTQLLLLMEDMMDGMKFPQAAMQPHRFQNGSDYAAMVHKKLDPIPEVIATFKVKVLFRQNASWQGKILWLEGGQDMAFRSALELVKLMDSALPQPSVSGQAVTLHEAISAG